MDPDRLLLPRPCHAPGGTRTVRADCRLPLVCPHGHVDPRLFSDPAATFGSPADLFIIPDHYVTRMLYSQGIPLEKLGVPFHATSPGREMTAYTGRDRSPQDLAIVLREFPPVPRHALRHLAGARTERSLRHPGKTLRRQCRPALRSHRRKAGHARVSARAACSSASTSKCCAPPTRPPIHWNPTRPSAPPAGAGGSCPPSARMLSSTSIPPAGSGNIETLSAAQRHRNRWTYASYMRALEQRREFFRSMGARATDHAVLDPATAELTAAEAEAIFQRALQGQIRARRMPPVSPPTC